MAILTATPNISPSSLTISGTTSKSATISWTCPEVPSNATISSCVLTGIATASMKKGSASIKVGGTTVTSGTTFTKDLGTSNTTSSIDVTANGGNKNANGTVTFSDLVYTVTYTAPVYYTVTFIDYDGTVLSEQSVLEGTSATPPSDPVRDDGYVFSKWDFPYDNVTSDLIITALYKAPNIFPTFTSEGWTLYEEATNTLLEDYSYGFTTESNVGWIGIYIPVPESWYGNAIKITLDSLTDNASLVVQKTLTYEEICVLNSTNIEGIARIVPGEQYTIFLRTNYLASGEVLVSNVYSEIEHELVPIDAIELNVNTLEIAEGVGNSLKCIVTPDDSTVAYNLVWTTDDNSTVSLGTNKLHCSLLGLKIGTCTVTVTDTMSGLSASCVVTVIENNNIIVNDFPPFNIPNTWFLDERCTIIDPGSYDYTFQAPATWCGMSISVPDSWYGNLIELRCDSISENAGLYVQEADTWTELGVLNTTTTSIQINMPEKGTYSDIKIALQAPSTAGTISITGAHATVFSFNDNDTYLAFNNRIVGYKKPEIESVIEDAIVCQTIDDVTAALSSATSGTTIYLRQGIYAFPSALEIGVTGTADKYISIKGYPGETVIISGTIITFLGSTKYLNFENIKITNLSDLHWAAAVKVSGGASYINFKNIEIYDINCKEVAGDETSGCNPFVIYGDTSNAITNINIENCYIHDCDTGWSEALTLNGNVEYCTIKNCTINNITNIGIDLAGNYEWTGTVGDANNQTRFCTVENCLVMNCQSPYATSAGLYSDGARDNTFRYNVIYNCQCGIELGSEQPGAASENFTIHNNLIIDSGRCIGIGAYLETGAQNRNAYIYNNTFICGDNNKENYGLYIERTENVNFYNNIVYGTANTRLYNNSYNSTVNIGNNCWYQPSGSKPLVDITGMFEDPLLVNNNLTVYGDYRLLENSPCINAGINASANYIGDYDLTGNTRINYNIVDVGAFESTNTITYIVTFKDWDGTVLKTEEIERGGNATAPSKPIREGYEFIGWDKAFTNVRSNMAINAVYKKICTITFVDWDGTVLKTQTVESGNNATAPDNPIREGYEFTGWDKEFTNVNSDLTVTAQYTILQYTVIFVDYDGTILKTQTVDYGSNAIAPVNPTREGYEFIGWDIGLNNIASDLTVTAMYEEKSESSSMYFGDINLNNIYMGDMIVKGIYFGEYQIYKQN